MFKRLFVITIILIILLLSVQYWLSPILSTQISQALSKKIDSDKIKVNINNCSLTQILTGKIDEINIIVQKAKLDKLVIQELNINLRDVDININIFFTGELEFKNINIATAKIFITEEELSNYISNNIKGVKNAEVLIRPEQVIIRCYSSLADFLPISVVLEGKIALDNQKIEFITERFSLNNSKMTNISTFKLRQIPISNLEHLPFGMLLRNINQINGMILIEADNQFDMVTTK